MERDYAFWIIAIFAIMVTLVLLLKKLGPGVKPPVPPPVDEPDMRPAQVAFVENIEHFKPLLKGLEVGNVDKGKWNDLIVDIYNKELLDIWKKVINRPNSWVRILASWGLSYDACTEFTYLKGREQLYHTRNAEAMKEGKVYTVESPCWIYTNSQGKKSVVLQGEVTLKA